MAINTLEFNTKLAGELDKVCMQKAVTGFFADNALRAKFVGAKTVKIPGIELSGLGDYDRDTGFITGSITISDEPYTLTQDRARSFQIDNEDRDETGIANLAGEVMGEFVRTKVVPEVDAYCLSKLAGLAVNKGQTISVPEGGTLSNSVIKMFQEGVLSVQNVVGFDAEDLVCFVNPTVWAAMQNTTELVRQMTVSDFSKGEITTKVKSINGISILPVSDARMKSAYTYYDGKTNEGETDQTVGGFVPDANAKSVGMLVLPKSAAHLVRKTEKIRTFTPDVNQKADAYKFDYRLYYDMFVKKSKETAIYAYVY